MTNAEIGRKLDKIIAILQLAHYESLDAARDEIRSDKTNAIILGTAAREAPAGKLVKSVKQKTGESERTINRRIATLRRPGRARALRGRPDHRVQGDRARLTPWRRRTSRSRRPCCISSASHHSG